MEKNDLPFYEFNTHVEAEAAIHSLSRSGFDMKKLSLVGKGYHTEEHPLGFYSRGDRIKAWGVAREPSGAVSGAFCLRRPCLSCPVLAWWRWPGHLSRRWSVPLRAQ